MRMRCSWQILDNDPKNQFVINPCFRRQLDITDPTSGTDAQALCDDLAAALDSWGLGTQLTVTAYNIEGAKPNYPMAEKVLHPDTPNTLYNYPPELAVVLSFYSQFNRPRRRGRLYVPAGFVGMGTLAGRNVHAGAITKVEALVPIFSGLGGTNVDWIVWSGADHAAHVVDHYWVDNGWDVQRSRGLPSTVKVVKTTSG
jgi:hypothetical protein